MLNITNLCFSYDNHKTLFSNVSLNVKKGETLSILGPNGVGKTTFLKCLLGFLKPTNGEILVEGKNMKKMNNKEFWKKVSYVPQGKQLNFPYSVLDMVLLGRASSIGISSKPSKKDIELAINALEIVGVKDLMDKPSNRISGGELQLVLIARAIVSKPEIMILDEPESNLDMKNQIIVLKVLEKLKEDEKLTTIVNTHYPNHAFKIAEKSLLMGYDGSHKIGETDKVITRDNIRKYFQVDSHFVRLDSHNCKCHKVLFPTDISSCCEISHN
jgi:iron complex transport system ATP-binding protein